jgi:hypothetical protein
MIELKGFEPMKVSKVPSYSCIHGDNTFGFEVVGSARRFFFVAKGDFKRNYLEKIPDWIQELLDNEKPKDPIGEEKALSKANDHYVSNGTTALMPEELTKSLFDKWQMMSIPERLIMLQTTDSRYVEERKGRGGKMYAYVKGAYMVQCANMAFGFAWTCNVQQWERTNTEVICMGYIEATIDNQVVRKYAVGQQDIAYPIDKLNTTPVCLGDNYKAAQTDMIKKALSYFGIAKDVYSGEV